MDMFNDRCRICLESSTDLLNIFDKTNNILNKFSTCLSIQITQEDLFPKSICKKCERLLSDFYEFYMMSKRSEKLILSYGVKEDSCTKLLTSEVNNMKQSDYIDLLSYDKSSDNKFLSEYLNSGSSAFDMNILTADTTSLPVLNSPENPETFDITQKLLQNGIKLKKIPSIKSSSVINSTDNSYEIHMEIDVSDSELDIVNELLTNDSKESRTLNIKKNMETYPEIYSCLLCKAIFNDINILANHMEKCQNPQKVCTTSKINIDNNESLILKESYRCKYCNKLFKTRDDLNQHIEKGHSVSDSEKNCIYRCKKCGLLFKNKDTLYKHANIHLKSKSTHKLEQNECKFCGKMFIDRATLNSHKKLNHVNVISDSNCIFRCKVCHAMYDDRNELYVHVKSHTQCLLCDYCGDKFYDKSLLNLHQKNEHK